MQILTDSEIKANKADIVIKNKQEKSCLLIDMSTPTEKNTSVKVTEKLSKFKDLEIEIEIMWGMKATTIPVETGVLGLTKKGLEKYKQQIPGNIKIHELQKITLLGTSHILKKGTLLGPRNGLGYCVVLWYYIKDNVLILTFSFYEYFTEVLCAALYKI